jgi:diguanylate cyclase (GGDEF)-like protein/PAS domain S-box-containing protein
VARTSPQSIVGYFLFLIGVLLTGAAFSQSTSDLNLYGIGRVLSYFAAGFMPVAFYAIYRQYTGAPPNRLLFIALSVIPVTTTILALTNSLHFLIWEPRYTETGLEILHLTDKAWFVRVHAPFAYGLFGFTVLAMASRLPSIAPAHRRTVLLLILCAVAPFAASVANTFLGLGDRDAPVLALSLAVLFPLFVYASLRLRVYEFSPVAYQTLFDHVRDPIIVLDKTERIICANRHAAVMLGESERALLGRMLWDEFPEARRILRRAIEMDMTQTLMLDNSNAYEMSVAPLLGNSGESQGTVVICHDVTERRKAQAKLANSEHLVRTLIETSSNGILRFSRVDSGESPRYRCIYANRAAESFVKASVGELVGAGLDLLEQLEPDRLLEHFENDPGSGTILSFETECREQGSWLRIVAEPIGDDFSVTLIDITDRKRDEDKMLEDALCDPLTGVFNRRGFEQAATTCIRKEDRAAVLYIDLNRFKQVNDEYGHQAGDALLKAFAGRLQHCLRSGDILGRLGGDEFAIVLPSVSLDKAMNIADRFVETVSKNYIIQGTEIVCTASVGVALMPHHGEDLWHLISVADQAMYNAKSSSRARRGVEAASVKVAIAS